MFGCYALLASATRILTLPTNRLNHGVTTSDYSVTVRTTTVTPAVVLAYAKQGKAKNILIYGSIISRIFLLVTPLINFTISNWHNSRGNVLKQRVALQYPENSTFEQSKKVRQTLQLWFHIVVLSHTFVYILCYSYRAYPYTKYLNKKWMKQNTIKQMFYCTLICVFCCFFLMLGSGSSCPRCTSTCRLIVKPEILDVPTCTTRCPVRLNDARDPPSERWN
jgi:hypothetical protein